LRKKRRNDRYDEPSLPEEGWFDYGSDSLLIEGYTEGGAPYGATRSELRKAIEREGAVAPWARAKDILRTAFQSQSPTAHIDVGRVTRVGQGLSRDVFAAEVLISPDPGSWTGPYAALLPNRRADEGVVARARREARLLHRLSSLELPFRIPRVPGAERDSGSLALVRSFLRGIELDLRAGHQASVRPWEIVGELAAAVHSLDAAAFSDLLPGTDTRRAGALKFLQLLEGCEAPEVQAAVDWARSRLPRDEPTVFVHGDLLGQNILLAPGQPLGLIDWEHAGRSDPARDLAIVTRGVKRPFQIDRGMERLLDAYAHFGGRPVEADHIHFYELVMAAGWYRDALLSKEGGSPQGAQDRLRSLLRRLGA
jgi:aminoglycoside phosphotransferase (APT) family kinase protein